MGRVTGKTAYQDIRALLERGDFVTAEKLMAKFSRDMTEDQFQELNVLQHSVGQRRRLARRLKTLRRRWPPRFLWRWGTWLALAGGVAYIAFFLVWVRWLPRVAAQGPARYFQEAGYGLLMYLYFFFPVFLYDTKAYLEDVYRWAETKPELAEVLEIRQEDRTGQHFRSSQVYHYQASYAVARLLEHRRDEAETMRFYLYENGDGHSLIRGGEENLNPWSFHPGDVVSLYRDRTGFPSLTRHTRKSLTREWLRKLGSHGGWAALLVLTMFVCILKG